MKESQFVNFVNSNDNNNLGKLFVALLKNGEFKSVKTSTHNSKDICAFLQMT